jgi:NADPH:quinone reductase-like Zn-dependent oxidoreductase
MSTETMKALHLTKPSPDSPPKLALISVPKPSPKEGNVIVKIHASAIQPSDILNIKGLFPYTTFPRIPGRDFSGVVTEGPAELVGQEVYGTSGNVLSFTEDGAHAEFISVPIGAVAPKPKTLSWAQAATIGVPYTTASLALKKAGVKSGDTVLVLGANGAVGGAAAQLAASLGAKVLRGVRGDKGDVDTSGDPTLSALDELTEKKGVDVVIDTVGQPPLTAAAAKKLGRGGRLAFITAPRSGDTTLGIEMLDFYRLEKTLIGVNTLLYGVEDFVAEMKNMTPKFDEGSLTGPKEGEWNEVPLSDGVASYEKAGQRGEGKFVLVMA